MAKQYLTADEVRRLLAANPEVELGSLKLLDRKIDPKLDWDGHDAELGRESVLAYLRLSNVSTDLDLAERLLDSGLPSANHVATISRPLFVLKYAEHLGLDQHQAETLHKNATGIRNKTMQLWASVRGTVASPLFRTSSIDSVSDQVKDAFEDLPSYQELFGTLNYCACEECRSIFGPAAYLVDLLRIIDEYVTTPNSIKEEFLFNTRRPDISLIPLTCAKTTTLVPYLQIVNERLLESAAKSLDITPNVVTEKMATTLIYPQALPVNAPLDQIRLLLDYVGAGYGSVLAAWKAPATIVAARSLGLSPEQQNIVATPLTTDAAIAPYYNVAADKLGELSVAQTFLDKTWTTFGDLLTLVNQDLSLAEQEEGLQVNFFINQGLAGKWIELKVDPDTDSYVLTNIDNVAALDPINRLSRLSAILNQPAPDLDWALRCIQSGGKPVIDGALTQLFQLTEAAKTLSLTLAEISVMLGPIKTYGEDSAAGGSEFDRLFNQPAITARQGTYHPAGDPLNPGYQTEPLEWIPGSSTVASVKSINRVLPGLGLSLNDANALGLFLYGEVKQYLNVAVLSELYRHALMSQALHLPMARYLVFLRLMAFANYKTPTADEITKLVAAAQWMSNAGISVYQLDYVINGTASVYVNQLYQPASVAEWLSGLRVNISFPSNTAATDITTQVAVLFGVDNGLADSVLSMSVAAENLPPNVTTWEEAFLTLGNDGKPYGQYVGSVLGRVSRWLVLVDALKLTDETVASVRHFPGAYGLQPQFEVISWTAVENIYRVQNMMQQYGDLQRNLLLYIKLVSIGPEEEDPLDVLQKATNWPPAQVAELLNGPAKESVISERLGTLQKCFELMNAFGADATLMASIAALGDVPATDWSTYLTAADLVMGKTVSRYGDSWAKIWTSLAGDLNVHLRDALLALVLAQLNSLYSDIKAPRNVYEFLLTDVEMGPTTQISYIKEALNAAQLYLQRCRLRLEPGVTNLSHIQNAWWDWMMNYRIWEANRQIFVYPENYLIPTLRKNVTPQFATLAQSLQQSDISKTYVDSAFRTYIDDFADVSQLKPVDAYRTIVHDTPTIYLLARSKTGPYTYFYCRQPLSMPWTPWEKIDLTINSPTCTILYAFSRLFLFWNEIKKNNTSAVTGSGGSVNTTNSTTYTTSVMYSFINQQGTWVQPQTLVDQAVVLFEADDNRNIALKNLDIFEGLFNMNDLIWKKIFAVDVVANNYDPPHGNETEAERIAVTYGPLVLNTGETVDAETKPPTSDPNASEFWRNLHEQAENHNRMVEGQLSGNLPLRPVSILNMSLENDVLINDQECVLLDPYQAKSPLSLIRAAMQSSGEAMQISHTSQPITDNYLAVGSAALAENSSAAPIDANSFVAVGINSDRSTAIFQALKNAQVLDNNGYVQPSAMATLDLYTILSPLTIYDEFGPSQYGVIAQILYDHMQATELFGAVGSSRGSVAPVGTQPGWFMFTTGDEVFLLSPRPVIADQPVFSNFLEGLTVGDPLLVPTSFIMSYGGKTPGSIDSALSTKVYKALVQFNIINNGQVVAANATIENLQFALGGIVTSDQITYVLHILFNRPMLFDDAFVGEKIVIGVSQEIFAELQRFSIVDANGRTDESNLTGTNVEFALGNMLLQNKVTRGQIAGIYSILAHAPKAISLIYTNHGTTSGLNNTSDFVFEVTRLSTGAVGKVSRALFVGGVDSLLSLRTQEIPVIPVLPFERFAPSKTNLAWPNALDATQVDFDGLYGQYYWEIFYHVSMLVAYSLNTNQRFSEAMAWLQYIFNPTIPEHFVTADLVVSETRQSISTQQAAEIITQLQAHKIGNPLAPILDSRGEVNPDFKATTDLSFLKTADPTLTERQLMMVRNVLLNYQLNAPASHSWLFRPFRNHTLQTLKDMLSDKNPAIKVYNDDPFDPFAIARLRIGAFEKSTVMQYVDNLIAWGDQLFTQDTWESITAAYMLYVYAYNLLGPKPEQVGECPGSDRVLNFAQIKTAYPDGIPQFLIDLEHIVNQTGTGVDVSMMDHAFNDLYVYFCVPENSELMLRWDTIQDRMYKINQSMNIQGVVRTLLLFEPPLNPLDLVKASAAGNNVQATATAGPELSPWRYSSAIATAQNLCATLIELGGSLLAALEKKDAAGLASLRTNQETQILDMMMQIKEDRITELQATIQSLNAAQVGASNRLTFYTDMVEKGLSTYELTSLSAAEAALAFNILGGISKTAATIAYAVPQVGSPFAMTYGGVQIGSAVNAASGVFEIGAEISNYISQRAGTMGSYERRSQEWSLQKEIAQSDVDSIVQQIVALEAQLQSALQDLAIQKTSIAQNKVIETYLNAQFTNEALYQWMVGRLATVYFQTYSLALQSARQVEAAYQFELDSSRTFLLFDYWDGLHKGLTAGEGLRLALNRLDDAYRTGDKRRLEIERTVSLAMIAPDQLLALKNTGKCQFSLTESLFDYDYPGQYARKIKTISVSIPAIVGPYQNVKAILTQSKNCVVTAPAPDAVEYLLGLNATPPLAGLRCGWAPNQSIAVSRGVDDSGLFVLDFNDPRYLPFENTGVVSDWTLEMPIETNRFDFQQLSDVIITVRYTALFDGGLETAVKNFLKQAPLTGGVYVNARLQSAAWQAFLSNHSDAGKQTLTLKIDPSQIGFFKSLTYTTVILQLNLADGVSIPDGATFLSFKSGGEPTQTPSLDHGQGAVKDLTWNGKTLPTAWEFQFTLDSQSAPIRGDDGFIDSKKLLNMQAIILYDAKVF